MKNFVIAALIAIQQSSVLADQIMAPARMRINTDLIQTIFHTGDQRILTMFEDMHLAEPVENASDKDGQEPWGLKEMTATVKPKHSSLDEYDFILSMKDPAQDNFFGIIGNGLWVHGNATTLHGNEFSFEADLTTFK